ncbi:DNA ligase D (plasmid) [Gemmatirosa kalamazoonensis]|uniref:DNA ligase (ATP) n=1 Tax=Gemmatirosa kalamazoonensis TaxID=861299 RepID=W0RSS2_9BACT|nr:DNA ligase D [Gemmatirosa kalamazoonensis]AHG93522.1 DNA ligase D [Gemmatirosa kalamazoonensis]
MTADGNEQTPTSDHLSRYRAKRSADTTPEPMGSVSPVLGRLFVVHKHAARQLHFDLRLEMDGVLRSWAVPKGPSYDMNDRRLAVKVEDHPIEYGDFEGIIPAGNYGAGGIIVWDRGEWVPLEDWREGLEKGKLLFELRGHKLHGKWTLVKIKKSDRDWLFIKERDAWVRTPGDDFPETSVLSGLTVEEVKAGKSPTGRVRAALMEAGAPATRVDPRAVEVMLAEPADEAFTRAGWLFEPKLDGYRLLAAKTRGDVLLLTRNGNDYTNVFPEIARAVRAIPCHECIVDGEVVVLDPRGMPNFALMQRRGQLTSPLDIRRMAVELPATYYAFDLLAFEEFDVRPLPLVRRKALLAELVPSLGVLRSVDHHEREGERFLQHASAIGLEGMIAKRADAPYRGGRTDAWLKIKSARTGDFAIVGFTAPNGGRRHFGALQLADMVGGRLVYAGRVGTGFDDAQLARLGAMLQPVIRSDAPCDGPVAAPGAEPAAAIPETGTTTWVDPVHVCEVRYAEWTPDGLLRHASFLRMRTDKHPRDCDRQRWPAHEPEPVPMTVAVDVADAADAVEESEAAPVAPEPPRPVEKTFAFSNLSKRYWPAEGYTKGDLVEYYRAIAPRMLPYLSDRPVVLTRFPDGIEGKSFYQKDAPEFTPPWVRTIPIWSEESQREIRYFVCNDVETLLYLANMASIPLHIWASRVGSLEQTDWCVIDLDPKEAPFSDVVRTALVLREICESIGLPSYVKTTGKTGLHILVPLGRQCTYAQSRMLGELLARVVLARVRDIATITRHVTKRGDKVYLDYLQNRHGQTIVAPFSVRPLPGATVSMPLRWEEVNASLDPKAFTIRTALDRMDRLGVDPMLDVLAESPDLQLVLQRLAQVLAADAR